MLRWPKMGFLLGTILTLQGCVAVLIPVAAGGVLVKARVEAAKRARLAEASMKGVVEPVVIVGDAGDPAMTADIPGANAVPAAPALPSEITQAIVGREISVAEFEMPNTQSSALGASKIRSHAYLDFAKYALAQADKRDAREVGRSAVLVEKVSLAFPKMIECSIKPLAVIIDIDVDQRKTWDVEASNGMPSDGSLAEVVEMLRARDIKLIWFTDGIQSELPEILGPLRNGAFPAVKSDDLVSFGAKRGARKQERRWKLARDYCVVAVAGDTKSDFDELYDYLRDQSYAIRLDAFWNRGWFLLPPPTKLANADPVNTTPNMDNPQ